MKQSLKFLAIFAIGVLIGIYIKFPESIDFDFISEILLYMLVFSVGISLAKSEGVFRIIKTYHLKLFLLPLMIIIGSLVGSVLLGMFYPDVNLKHSLGLGSGLGYYSLSSLMISQYGFKEISAIALMSNILRELITLITAPIMIKVFGRFAPIASAGATSMDTTLGVVLKHTGEKNAVISMFNGVILSLMVPLLITLIYSVL